MATESVGPSVASSPPLTAEGRRNLMRGTGAPRGRRGDTLTAYLFLAPYLFVLIVFFLVVSVYGIGLSLFKVDIGFTTPVFVGLRNYQVLFQQLANPGLSDFWVSMTNIIKFVVAVVIGQTILALLLVAEAVVFSVIVDEWPAVRAGLEARLQHVSDPAKARTSVPSDNS